jgi:chromosomal replication initiation ATPase DnaA
MLETSESRTFTNAQELHEHYKAVKLRLRGPYIPRPMQGPPKPKEGARDFLFVSTKQKVADLYKCSQILKAVSDYSYHSLEVLTSQRRSKIVTHYRKIYYYLARYKTTQTYSQIAKICGDRDHTTALHGISVVEANLHLYQRDIDGVLELLE